MRIRTGLLGADRSRRRVGSVKGVAVLQVGWERHLASQEFARPRLLALPVVDGPGVGGMSETVDAIASAFFSILEYPDVSFYVWEEHCAVL